MSLVAGSFGSITFLVPEIMNTEYEEYAEYIQVPVISGYPRLHKLGDPLYELALTLRFDSGFTGLSYNTSAKDKLDLLRAEIGSTTPKALTLNGVNLGNYLVKKINWTVLQTAGTGKPIKIDAKVIFLANPV